MKLQRKEIYINNLKTVYFRGGEGKTILFLHGGRIRALTYKKSLELLSDKYTVIAPDIPFFGETETPQKSWHYDDYNHFFNNLLEKLQLNDVIIIGHSMGGGLAFHLALANPRISKLILVNANGIGFSGKSALSIEVERFLFYLTSPQYYTTFAVLIRDAIFHYSRHFFDIKKADRIRRDYTNGKETLKKITIPTLLLWSTHDSIFPLNVGQTFHKLIKDSVLEVVDGTHDWLLYNPFLFYKKVVEFVK